MAHAEENQGTDDRRYLIAGGILIAISLAARAVFYPIISVDYTTSVSRWVEALSVNPGLSAFIYPFADYSPMYLYLLKLLTLIHGGGLYAVKTLSVLFDVVIAVVACLLIRMSERCRYTKSRSLLAGAVMFAIPTVVVNSSLWAQSDAIYAAFTLLSLYFIVKDKPVRATLAFGIAISLKLQAIFFIPVLIGYLLTKRNGVWQLLYIPVIFAATIIPAALSGASFLAWFTIYARQSSEFSQLTLSAPTIFSFLDSSSLGSVAQGVLSSAGIILAAIAAISVIRLTKVSIRREEKPGPEKLIFLALLSAVIVPFLLPHMHERYFYLADILSVIYAFYVPRYRYVAIAVVLSSLFSYLPFLSGSIPALGRYLIPEGILGFVMLCVAAVLFGKAVLQWRRSFDDGLA